MKKYSPRFVDKLRQKTDLDVVTKYVEDIMYDDHAKVLSLCIMSRFPCNDVQTMLLTRHHPSYDVVNIFAIRLRLHIFEFIRKYFVSTKCQRNIMSWFPSEYYNEDIIWHQKKMKLEQRETIKKMDNIFCMFTFREISCGDYYTACCNNHTFLLHFHKCYICNETCEIYKMFI